MLCLKEGEEEKENSQAMIYYLFTVTVFIPSHDITKGRENILTQATVS